MNPFFTVLRATTRVKFKEIYRYYLIDYHERNQIIASATCQVDPESLKVWATTMMKCNKQGD